MPADRLTKRELLARLTGAALSETGAVEAAPIDDELRAQMRQAEHVLRESGRTSGCISFVQRRLAISYNRAALIISHLVAQGVLTDADDRGERRLTGKVCG